MLVVLECVFFINQMVEQLNNLAIQQVYWLPLPLGR